MIMSTTLENHWELVYVTNTTGGPIIKAPLSCTLTGRTFELYKKQDMYRHLFVYND